MRAVSASGPPSVPPTVSEPSRPSERDRPVRAHLLLVRRRQEEVLELRPDPRPAHLGADPVREERVDAGCGIALSTSDGRSCALALLAGQSLGAKRSKPPELRVEPDAAHGDVFCAFGLEADRQPIGEADVVDRRPHRTPVLDLVAARRSFQPGDVRIVLLALFQQLRREVEAKVRSTAGGRTHRE